MRTIILLLTLAAPVFSADPPSVKLPKDLTAEPGQLVKIVAETDGKIVKWIVFPEGGDLIPFPDGKTAIFAARKSGKYSVFAYTAAGDVPSDLAKLIVSVESVEPPPPPRPVDPIVADLKAAYNADTSSNKLNDIKTLAALYRLMALETVKAEYSTATQLNSRYRAAVAAIVPPLGLVAVRQRAAVEVAAAAGTDPDGALTDGKRKTLADVFTKLANACDEVTK